MTISQGSCWTDLQNSLIDLRFRGSYPQLDTFGLPQLAQKLVQDYCDGKWQSILTDPHVQNYFHVNRDQEENLEISIAPMQLTKHDPAEITIRLTTVATLLSIFVQVNFTGPVFPCESVEIFGPSDLTNEATLNTFSLSRLSLAGEPAYHLAKSATFIFLAIEMLNSLSTTTDVDISRCFPTLTWWKLRAGILQRKLIEEQIPFSNELLEELDRLSEYLTELNATKSGCQTAQDTQDLLPMLTLERGLAEHLTGNEKQANKLFLRAAEEAALECKFFFESFTGSQRTLYLSPN